MSVITRMRKQQAVWWGQTDAPDSFGVPRLNVPVQILCRWDDETVEFIGKDGTPQVSKAVVYVDRDMQIGDILWLGSIANIATSQAPRVNAGWVEIKGWKKNPNFKASEFLRTAYC
jgi:hypothetical protein